MVWRSRTMLRCLSAAKMVRWQGLAQAWQGQEVERLREVPQRLIALAMARSVEAGGPKQQR